jgi:esterase/lipase
MQHKKQAALTSNVKKYAEKYNKQAEKVNKQIQAKAIKLLKEHAAESAKSIKQAEKTIQLLGNKIKRTEQIIQETLNPHKYGNQFKRDFDRLERAEMGLPPLPESIDDWKPD